MKTMENNKKIKDMDLSELFALKTVVKDQSDDVAKSLTNYATTNSDYEFEMMGTFEKSLYEKRNKYVKLLNKIDFMISKKIDELIENERKE